MRSLIDLSCTLMFAVSFGLLAAGPIRAEAQQAAAVAPQIVPNLAISPSLLLPQAAIAPIHASPAAGPESTGAAAPGGPVERWVDARRVDRLEASLVELAHADSLVRHWGALGGLILGGALIAGGVLVAADDEAWGGRGRAAVSVSAWSAGASLIAAGVYRFFSTTPAEDRLKRWSGLRQERKLDVFEFARIEGELASEAEDARFNRRLAAFSSFGLVAGGAGLIGLAASSELEGSIEKDAYILGSVVVGVGAIQTVALLCTRTPAERAWKHYAEGGAGFFSELRTTPRAAPHLAWR